MVYFLYKICDALGVMSDLEMYVDIFCNVLCDNKLSGVEHLVRSRLSLIGSRCYPTPFLKFVASLVEFTNRRDVQLD